KSNKRLKAESYL
ncbi:unnamed protein product, partial [Allacma fusca]